MLGRGGLAAHPSGRDREAVSGASNHRLVSMGKDGVGSAWTPTARPGRRVPLTPALRANPFFARAARAKAEASQAHPALGAGRPPPGEAWEMREVVRLVSGARPGIHAGWQASVGQGGGEWGGQNPVSSAGEAPQESFVLELPGERVGSGCSAQQASLWGNPVSACECVHRLPPLRPLQPRPLAGQGHLEE